MPFRLLRSIAWEKVKQPTFGDATTGFPAKWRLRNERRNSILMTRHYPDLGSASDWSCRVGNLIQPIRSTTQIWVVTRHQYGISALVSQTSFGGETNGSVAKCRRMFSQAKRSIKTFTGSLLAWQRSKLRRSSPCFLRSWCHQEWSKKLNKITKTPKESITWSFFPRRGFRIPGTGFQSLSVERGFWIPTFSGFRIPWAVFWIPEPRITQANISRILYSGIRILLPGANGRVQW